MIIQQNPSGTVAIKQQDHAELAAFLLEHWSDHNFPKNPQRYFGVPIPVAIIAGDRDTLVRPARAEALRRAVPNLVFQRTISGAGHNDIYDRPELRRAAREALDRLLAGQRA